MLIFPGIQYHLVVMKSLLSSFTALEDRVDSNQDVLNLYGEQLGVHENSIALLEEQVNMLQVTDNTMEARLDALEAADMVTDHRLNELEVAINETAQDEFYDRVIELENITVSQQRDIHNLETAYIAHDNDIDALQDMDSEFEQRIAQLEHNTNANNVSVGFHARLTNGDLPSGTPIMYDNVLVNIGNRYLPTTGIFTANTAGLYFFEQYWLMGSNYDQYLYIWKNGVEQCRSLGNAYGSSDHNSPSCSAVMELSPRDEVYATSSHGYPVSCTDCAGFTGFLIKAY